MTEQQSISNQARLEAIVETAKLVPTSSKNNRTVTNFLTWGLFSLAIVFFGYVGYLLFWPNIPAVVTNPKVISADSKAITYQVHICKNTDATPILYKKLVRVGDTTAYGIPFMPLLGVANRGCRDNLVTVAMPAGVLPGKYVVQSDVAYQVNPLRMIHVYWSTPEFDITK